MTRSTLVNCVADWPLILEYARLLFAWPFIALVLGMWFMRTFRSPIAGFIGRIENMNLFGASAIARPSTDQKEQPAPEPKPVTTEAGPVAQARAPSELEMRLYEQYRFERAYNLIFGTQWMLLNFMRAQGTAGVDEGVLLGFLNQHNAFKAQSGEKLLPGTLDQYLEFLFRQEGFVRAHPDPDVKRAVLTSRGENFVAYILKSYTPPPFRQL